MESDSFWNAYHFESPVAIHFSFYFFLEVLLSESITGNIPWESIKQKHQLKGKIHLSHPVSIKKKLLSIQLKVQMECKGTLLPPPTTLAGHENSQCKSQNSPHALQSHRKLTSSLSWVKTGKSTAFWPLKSLLKGASSIFCTSHVLHISQILFQQCSPDWNACAKRPLPLSSQL